MYDTFEDPKIRPPEEQNAVASKQYSQTSQGVNADLRLQRSELRNLEQRERRFRQVTDRPRLPDRRLLAPHELAFALLLSEIKSLTSARFLGHTCHT